MRFYDLHASSHNLKGCIEAEAEFKGVRIAKYELGCFTIGPKHLDNGISVVRI